MLVRRIRLDREGFSRCCYVLLNLLCITEMPLWGFLFEEDLHGCFLPFPFSFPLFFNYVYFGFALTQVSDLAWILGGAHDLIKMFLSLIALTFHCKMLSEIFLIFVEIYFALKTISYA